MSWSSAWVGGRATSRLWEVRADGRAAREIGKIPGRAIRDIVRLPDGNTYWPAVGDKMVVRTHDEATKREGFYAIDPETGAAGVVAELDAVIRSASAASAADRRHLVYVQEAADRGEDLWQIDVETGSRRQLTRHSPQLESSALGRPRLIDWLSLAGEELRGALLLPAGYEPGRRYPLVVWVYGGHNGSDSIHRFGFGWGPVFNAQVLASRGYAVLYPDVPLHPGTPVQDVVSAVLPGVNKAIELGIADPERLAVMGQSFGGYNTLALVTQTPRFKAAVMTNAAAADLFEGYSRFSGEGLAAWVGYYEQGQGGMGGTP